MIHAHATMKGSTMRRRALAGIAAAMILISGCSGEHDSQEVEVGHLTLSVPQGWQEEPASGDFDKKWVGGGIELQVAGNFSSDPTASAAYSRLDLPATLGLDGYKGQGVVKHEVAGADTGVRADFTYTDGGETRSGIWIVGGQWPYPQTSAIALSGADLDTPQVNDIIESLHFTKTTQSERTSTG